MDKISKSSCDLDLDLDGTIPNVELVQAIFIFHNICSSFTPIEPLILSYHVHTHAHTHTQERTNARTYPCTHASMHSHTPTPHTHKHTHRHADTHRNTQTHIDTVQD